MKTPEQIAETIALPRVISSGVTLRQLMVAAIEADRAQRDEQIGNFIDRIWELSDEVEYLENVIYELKR